MKGNMKMTILEQLVGSSWTLVSFQSKDKQAKIFYPLGKDAKGIISFMQDHRTSVHVMAANREDKLSKEELARFTNEEEKRMAQLGYHAYSGPFMIDEEAKVLTTQVELSLIPSYIGTDQARAARIEGDLLYLSNIKHTDRQLVWRRN